MINKVGYACINENLRPRTFKSCRLKSVYNYGIDYLRNVIINNLDLTYDILEWNVENGIYMYRVSSDLMPLVTHPDLLKDFTWRWYEDSEILEKLKKIKTIVEKQKLRISMHPDQYTVLNSKRSEVVKFSIDYLKYHSEILEKISGQDMILHVGGVGGNKIEAIERFINQYQLLDSKIKRYLRIENDDKSFTISDVIDIYHRTGIPIVLDLHHHRCLVDKPLTNNQIDTIKKSWSGLTPKIHISSGKTCNKDRRHHDYITHEDCEIIKKISGKMNVDVMVEAKKKDLAVLEVMKYLKDR
ncbi:UV DNA damage repair endonuclease UvsE [Mycoplasmatota bacterium]|nr:UV DNA damage repair endonuclease UvsE [Mycoplasmatota bacterium]